MKDKKVENLKKRIGMDTICCYVIACAGLMSIFSKISLLVTMYRYARQEIGEMADILGEILGYVLICIIFIILGSMLLNIRKDGKPFSKANIKKVQVIAVLTMGCGILPAMATMIIVFICTGSAVLSYDVHEIFMMFLGGAIGILSEIFYYGNELQDDMDLIA